MKTTIVPPKNFTIEIVEKVIAATVEACNETKKSNTLETRYDILAKHLSTIQSIKFEDVGEKPARGANLSIIYLKDRLRVNYRCGYSRNNYAPCVEIYIKD